MRTYSPSVGVYMSISGRDGSVAQNGARLGRVAREDHISATSGRRPHLCWRAYFGRYEVAAPPCFDTQRDAAEYLRKNTVIENSDEG